MYPVPLETFVRYGLWFQQHAVPVVDETYVTSVARYDRRFRIALQDGRSVESGSVIMAVGPKYFANRPTWYNRLPPSVASHTCDHRDLSIFNGQRVIVVGAGQSAMESAALLTERGASVDVVGRRPIVWLEHDRTGERGLIERIRAPRNGLAPGWINWMLEKQPYAFYRLNQRIKDRQNGHWKASAAAWLKHRVVGKVALHESEQIVAMDGRDDHVNATLSGGSTIRAHHILLATGYQVDLNKLTMIDPYLRREIERAAGAIPRLSDSFETSVPGFYFVGLSSVHAFGPLYRFVAGCPAAARRVSDAIARSAAGRRRFFDFVRRDTVPIRHAGL
jgi:thioredoxin reductase